MSLEKRIMTDLKEAMKAKDQAALRTIRSIKSNIQLIKTDGLGTDFNEEAEIKLIQKLMKQRQDSLSIYEKEGREDLATTEREEIEVLKNYLPEQLSADELQVFISDLVEKTGAKGMKDMGKIMGMASQQLAGKADGKTISAVVKSILAG